VAALSFHRDREDFERFSSPLWAERFADHGAELLLIDALQLDAHPSRDANIRRPEVYELLLDQSRLYAGAGRYPHAHMTVTVWLSANMANTRSGVKKVGAP